MQMQKIEHFEPVQADLDMSSLIDLAIVVLVIGVIVVFGGTFLEDMRSDIDQTTANADAVEKALNDSETAFFKIPTKLGLLVTAVLFAVVIAIIVKYIWFGRNDGASGGM